MLCNAERLGLEVLAAALQPAPPVDLLAWAEANVVFEDGEFKGPWNRSLFPFFDEILRALGPGDPCRYVTVMSSAQVGKTHTREYILPCYDNAMQRKLSCGSPDE